VEAAASYWKRKRSQQKITASASILFGLNSLKLQEEVLISITLLFLKSLSKAKYFITIQIDRKYLSNSVPPSIAATKRSKRFT